MTFREIQTTANERLAPYGAQLVMGPQSLFPSVGDYLSPRVGVSRVGDTSAPLTLPEPEALDVLHILLEACDTIKAQALVKAEAEWLAALRAEFEADEAARRACPDGETEYAVLLSMVKPLCDARFGRKSDSPHHIPDDFEALYERAGCSRTLLGVSVTVCPGRTRTAGSAFTATVTSSVGERVVLDASTPTGLAVLAEAFRRAYSVAARNHTVRLWGDDGPSGSRGASYAYADTVLGLVTATKPYGVKITRPRRSKKKGAK